ncbi:hypothetical protein BGZ94_008658 [Podila epigama]|nr:hypothetical protein BGZ94_008658 [Podila epigama]
MDKKQHPIPDDSAVERDTFGSQHPFAAASPSGPAPNFGPSNLPPLGVPGDVPPTYSPREQPLASASAPPPRNPQPFQPNGYQPVPQEDTSVFPPPPPPPPLPVEHTGQREQYPSEPQYPSNYGAIRNKSPPPQLIIGDSCAIPDTSQNIESELQLPAAENFELKVAVEDIPSNVIVKESEDSQEKTIKLVFGWQASNDKLLNAIGHTLVLNSTHSDASFKIFVRGDGTEKKRLLRENCAQATVKLIYPRSIRGTGRLKVDVLSGDIHFKFSKSPSEPPPFFGSLVLYTVSSDIQLENVPVLHSIKIESVNGRVHGSLRTAGVVNIGLVNGAIDLTVDTEDAMQTKDPSDSQLDIQLSTVNGPIDLAMLNTFHGHFDLMSSVGRPSIESPDQIHYKTKTTSKAIGWVSADGKEPARSLPRMNLHSFNGNVKAIVTN